MTSDTREKYLDQTRHKQSLVFRSSFYEKRLGTIFFLESCCKKCTRTLEAYRMSCLCFKLFCRRVELGVGYIFSDITERHQAGGGLLNSSKSSLRCRSNCPEVFYRRSILENFSKLTGKNLCHSLFFNKAAGWDLQLY